MSRRLRGLASVLLMIMIVCAGCTSVPVHYYTLIAPEEATESVENRGKTAIDVRVVHMPGLLNRSELMFRSGPTEVTFLENERWASPLNDEIRDAVRYELRNRFARTTDYSGGCTVTQLSITIDIERIDAEPGRYALVEATWGASTSGATQAPPRPRNTGLSFSGV